MDRKFHAADCGVPLVNRNVKLNYNSTLDDSVLTLTCENDTSTDEQILLVMCHSNGGWIPDPAQFTCASFTTVPPGTESKLHDPCTHLHNFFRYSKQSDSIIEHDHVFNLIIYYIYYTALLLHSRCYYVYC